MVTLETFAVGLPFIVAVGWFILHIYLQSRWTILDLGVTLIGGTLPVNLTIYFIRGRSFDVDDVLSLIAIGLGGLLWTVFGSGLAMGLIHGLKVERPLPRMGLLVLGWAMLFSVFTSISGAVILPGVLLAQHWRLIPLSLALMATAVVWIPWWMLARHRQQKKSE